MENSHTSQRNYEIFIQKYEENNISNQLCESHANVAIVSFDLCWIQRFLCFFLAKKDIILLFKAGKLKIISLLYYTINLTINLLEITILNHYLSHFSVERQHQICFGAGH